MRTVAMVARFDHPAETTLDDMRVELLYPMDDVAEQFFRSSATGHLGDGGAAVVTIATARRTDPTRAVLLGLSTWFGVQAVTAWWGVIAGTVGGFAWLAMVADPLIAAWFLFLSRRSTAHGVGRRPAGASGADEVRYRS